MQMCPSCSWNNFDNARFCSRCGELLKGLLGQGEILIGRYRVLRVLGCGGMGAVYLAEDLFSANRPVAVKENFESSPESAQQFQTEAEILSQLRHRNLPRVSDFFVSPDSGKQYLVMEYVSGEDLEEMVQKRGPLAPGEAHRILSQVADAVSYLHSQSPPVIHRDIKPSNIKVGSDGRVVLVDLGIAKRFQPGKETVGAAAAVTPGYSPPEQYGQGITDPRSDQYALAATYYFALTGHAPPEAIDRITRGDRLVPPSRLNPSAPPHLEQAILKAMSLKPADRFASIADFMRSAGGHWTPSPGPPRRTRPAPYPSRRTRSSVDPAQVFSSIFEMMFWLLVLWALAGTLFGGCRGCIIIPIPLLLITILAVKGAWLPSLLLAVFLAGSLYLRNSFFAQRSL